jgi:hypothetical protein
MHVSHSRLPRSVTALSLIEGAVTRLAAPNCNPARPLPFFLAGKCPLHARAIVILSWGYAWLAQQILAILPLTSVYKPAHTNVHNNSQRQKHEQNGRPAITH